MPISITCSHCGKGLKVKDDWAGKRAKCPGCCETFTVPGGGGSAGPTMYNPAAAAAAKGERQDAAGKLSISWGPIMLGALVFGIVGVIYLFISGPKKVWNEWEEIGGKAHDDVIDVVSLGLKAHASEMGAYNPRKSTGPEAKEVMFFRPGFVMSMPNDVDFRGGSSEGEFKGVYHPKTGEVEADVTVGAQTSLLTGKSKGGTQIKITGRTKGGKVVAEVNGKNAVIVIPPKSDDE